jgi:hypothetical protein
MPFPVSVINSLSNGACDLLFRPFRGVHPLIPLAVFSFFTGVVMLVVYRFTSDQKAIRRAKDRMQAHVLAVRLYQDQLGVVLRSYGRILGATLGYLRLSLVPLLVMFVPLALLLVQLDARFAYRPPRAGEALLLHVQVAQPELLDGVTLGLPKSVALTAPLLRDAVAKEVVARIEPHETGIWTIRLKLAGRDYSKQLIVGDRLENISTARVGPGLLDRLLHPVEDPLPPAAPIVAIALDYPERRITLGHIELNWIVVFFILSLIAGLAMKRPLRAEF